MNESESDSDSDNSTWSHGSDSTGELIMCMKCKLNDSVNDNTYPSPNKAIQQNKIKLNNKIEKWCKKINKENLTSKKMSLIISMCLMTPPMFL